MVTEHAEEGMDLPVLRGETEAMYATRLDMFARDVEAGQCTKDWLGHS